MTNSIAAVIVLMHSAAAWAAPSAAPSVERMPQMPLIHPKRSYAVPSEAEGRRLLEGRGFGAREPEVRAMNLMMVEGARTTEAPAGSPEHGELDAGDLHVAWKLSGGVARVGTNPLELVIRHKDGSVARGLRPQARVRMRTMDMGEEKPRVDESVPGSYRLEVPFSMDGTWEVRVVFSGGQSLVLPFEAVARQ